MASAASPRPTTPAVTPAINTILGPEELDLRFRASWTSGFCVSVGCAARVVVAKVVGRDIEAPVLLAAGVEVGGISVEVSVEAVVEGGPASVVDGKEAGAEDSVGVEDVDDGKSVEIGGLDVDDAGVDVGPATGSGSEAATEISNGGLYSKVLVKSSIIFKPYLSPGGKLLVPAIVFGMFHVKVPVFEIEAFKIKGFGKQFIFEGEKEKEKNTDWDKGEIFF